MKSPEKFSSCLSNKYIWLYKPYLLIQTKWNHNNNNNKESIYNTLTHQPKNYTSNLITRNNFQRIFLASSSFRQVNHFHLFCKFGTRIYYLTFHQYICMYNETIIITLIIYTNSYWYDTTRRMCSLEMNTKRTAENSTVHKMKTTLFVPRTISTISFIRSFSFISTQYWRMKMC